MKDFVSPHWQEILAYNGLRDFTAFWQRQIEWFETPNVRRGGWSGVGRTEITLPDGSRRHVFVKRQEDHGTRTLWHPFRGEPTFAREFRCILQYQRLGIPALTPVYFASRIQDGHQRAILVTEKLIGFRSLEQQAEQWLRDCAPNREQRRRILAAVASVLRQLHQHHIQHSSFAPKHIFTRQDADGQVEVRIIDLEKSRRCPTRFRCGFRDLYTLFCEAQCWGRSDRLYFLKSYLQIERLTPAAKRLWRGIAKRAHDKGRIQPGTPKLHGRSSDPV